MSCARSTRLDELPSLEYLFHVLVVFGTGGAAATFWWASSQETGAPRKLGSPCPETRAR